MAFKPSKERKARPKNTVSEGKPIIPNDGIARSYEKQIMALANSMIADYRDQVKRTLENPAVEAFYATDSAASDIFKRVMFALNKKWTDVFKGFVSSISTNFVEEAAAAANKAAWGSLSAAGVTPPIGAYNQAVSNTLSAAKDYNSTLITGIKEEVHEKIYSAVMLSLTSPNPEEQGASGIQNALREVGITAKNRAELIAKDQTSKLYSSLATERFREAGCTHIRWLHSSAGKVPRPTHVAKNDQVFELDDPRFWQGPKADQGPPGWAIRCRCRAVPVFGYYEDDSPA